MNTTATETSSPRASNANKVVLIVVGVAIVAAGALYFWGLHQGRGELAVQKTQYEQKIEAMQASVTQAQAALAASTNRIRFLEARAGLYRTAVDIDERNFGTANTHLQAAADTLASVKGAIGNVDAKQLSTLHDRINATNIEVATNLEAQRGQILAFGEQMDAMAAGDATLSGR